MMSQTPQIVDIRRTEEESDHFRINRYLSTNENNSIIVILNCVGLLSKIDEIRELSWNCQGLPSVTNVILKYIHRNNLVNYSSPWYLWLSGKIMEFKHRYTGNTVWGKNSGSFYNGILKLYIHIYLNTTIFNARDVGRELDYYVASQFSSKYHLYNGLLTKMHINEFMFRDSVTNYLNFKSTGFPPNMVAGRVSFQFIDYLTIEQKARLTRLEDHKYAPFFDIATPIYQLKIPKLKRKKTKWLIGYLHSLEVLMCREFLLNREYKCFLLSIEHLRVFTNMMARGLNDDIRRYKGSLTS